MQDLSMQIYLYKHMGIKPKGNPMCFRAHTDRNKISDLGKGSIKKM